MRPAARRCVCACAIVFGALIRGGAQERSAAKPDPRVGLKPGLYDAGEAAWNMERIAGMPKPEGFFDPKAPAGNPTPPERDPNAPADPNAPPPPPRDPAAPPPFDPVPSTTPTSTN